MPSNENNLANSREDQSVLFGAICDDLHAKSYSVQHQALPKILIDLLYDRVTGQDGPSYKTAGIGRSTEHHLNQNIRRDEISWIGGEIGVDNEWLKWTEALRTDLNRQLLLGLVPIESHYARYPKGGFYKRHVDAFTGPNNRKVSLVLFLNAFWKNADKGELRLFVGEDHKDKILITPQLGTLVTFLSDEIPHEVLSTSCIRHSIAGWYR